MRRKKLKAPFLADKVKQDGITALLKRRKSETDVLEAYFKMPYSSEIHKAIRERTGDLLDAQRSLDSMLADTVASYEDKIASLQADKKRLERENKGLLIELRKSLKISENKSELSAEKEAEAEEKSKRLGKRGAPPGHRGTSRTLPLKVDAEEVVQPPRVCDCGCNQIFPLDSSDDKYIEDIAPVVKTVTKVRYLMGKCASCGKVVRSQKGVSGPPVETGRNIGALLTMMRQYGMTYGSLSKLCTDILDIPVTRSGVLGIVNRHTDQMRIIYEIIGNHMPKENILHGDETGWKVRGKSGYIWILCNKKAVYFHYDKSRAGYVVEDLLGTDYKGIVVCDFYGGYNVLENTQRCLGHFLKDIKKQCEIYRGSKALHKFKDDVKAFIRDGLEVQKMSETEQKEKAIKKLGNKLDVLSKAKLPRGEPENLAKRIHKFKDQMMLFIKHPDVEYHNNRAERHLRPMVISRKNSFGSDTATGAERICILQSVVETCKVNNIRPYEFIRKIIKANPKVHNVLTVPLLHS